MRGLQTPVMATRYDPNMVREVLMCALTGPCCRSEGSNPLPDTTLSEEEAAALVNAVVAALTRIGMLEPEEEEATAL
ncbi:MAG: hypothetical protein ACOY94_04875 [Bacillota bacterium]